MADTLIVAIATIVGAVLGGLAPHVYNSIRASRGQKYKFAYVKVQHLRRMRPGVEPVCARYVQRLRSSVDVYDEFHYFRLNVFKADRERFTVKDSSRNGTVDLHILHPWQQVVFSDVTQETKRSSIEQLIRTRSSVYFTRSMYFNGFQEGEEHFAMRMEADTEEARMIVDFSAIPHHSEIIRGIPKGVRRVGDREKPAAVLQVPGLSGVYEFSGENLQAGEVLRVEFDVDWEHPSLNPRASAPVAADRSLTS